MADGTLVWEGDSLVWEGDSLVWNEFIPPPETEGDVLMVKADRSPVLAVKADRAAVLMVKMGTRRP